uniref:RNA polymerase sigma factor 70 region 4 type 2 domain-containing protein n=1 Tax=Thermofilum pendens TaxID=2269 RepID=A0A7J3X7W7_THEPE
MQLLAVDEELLSDLTDTERRIVEAYLRYGGRAKDIASLLGVSERTVYKALYKYRKLAREKGLDASAFYLRGGSLGALPRFESQQPRLRQARSQGVDVEELKREILEALIPVVEEAVRRGLERALVLGGWGRGVASRSELDSSTALLARLAEGIERLNENIVKLNHALMSSGQARAYGVPAPAPPQPAREAGGDRENGLPSFVVGNPWVELLSKRAFS